MQRSLLLFENSLKTKATTEKYLYYLKRFKNFYKLKDYDSMLTIELKQLQIMIEDYVMTLKKEVSPNSVNTYMAGIEAFFETNDVELRWKKIRRLYPAKVKKTGGKMWTTEEIDLMLKSTRDLRQKALIHFLAASGVRRGAIPDLKIKHIQKIENCYAISVYEGSLEEYTTFIHQEAAFWLDKYLEKRKNDGEYLDKNSPLFRKSYQLGIQKALPMNDELVLRSIWYIINKSGLRAGQEKKSGRYDTQTNHGFRKRWTTIIENVEGVKVILAEKMMGHSIKSIPMAEIYNLPTTEMLFKEYKKAIPELIIDGSARKQAELDKVYKEKSILEEEKSKNKSLMTRLEKVERMIFEKEYVKIS
ncbi:MAG: site-specific integrase [Thaumarchaeota archaeon]|nr:site-specific integrase [Nitrososphaerota archaeon]